MGVVSHTEMLFDLIFLMFRIFQEISDDGKGIMVVGLYFS